MLNDRPSPQRMMIVFQNRKRHSYSMGHTVGCCRCRGRRSLTSLLFLFFLHRILIVLNYQFRCCGYLRRCFLSLKYFIYFVSVLYWLDYDRRGLWMIYVSDALIVDHRCVTCIYTRMWMDLDCCCLVRGKWFCTFLMNGEWCNWRGCYVIWIC